MRRRFRFILTSESRRNTLYDRPLSTRHGKRSSTVASYKNFDVIRSSPSSSTSRVPTFHKPWYSIPVDRAEHQDPVSSIEASIFPSPDNSIEDCLILPGLVLADHATDIFEPSLREENAQDSTYYPATDAPQDVYAGNSPINQSAYPISPVSPDSEEKLFPTPNNIVLSYENTNKQIETRCQNLIPASSNQPMSQIVYEYDDICGQTQCSRSSQGSKISGILRIFGRKSPERSLIKRALKLRYSFSSLDTSSQHSRSNSPLISQEKELYSFPSFSESDTRNRSARQGPGTQLPIEVIAEQQEYIQSENRVVVRECCSKNQDCLHRKVIECVKDPSLRLEISLSSHLRTLGGAEQTVLFFAASVGAPLHVLVALIAHLGPLSKRCDLFGRTFMFYLDPRGILAEECACDVEIHGTAFECLMMNLKSVDFPFEHVDHESKNFMDLLCLSEHFSMSLLLGLMDKDSFMSDTIECFAGSRDTFGLSFIDRISNTDLREWAYFWMCHTPRKTYHQYQERMPQVNILLENAYEQSKDDEDLFALAQLLYDHGANLDCPSHLGVTPLLYAVGKACPKTVRFLLSIGVSHKTKDKYGLGALDYSMNNFNAYRKATAPALRLADLMKTATYVMDHDSAQQSALSLEPAEQFESFLG